MNRIIIVSGVSGSGKTTIGKMLSKQTEIPFYDADDYHPKRNLEKMKAGHPLDDGDREIWLESMAAEMSDWEQRGGAVLACSALKEKYRKKLDDGSSSDIIWIMLEGSYDLIKERMESRKDHFFDASLLQSQFAIYERPSYGYCISIDDTPKNIVDNIIKQLKAKDELDGL